MPFLSDCPLQSGVKPFSHNRLWAPTLAAPTDPQGSFPFVPSSLTMAAEASKPVVECLDVDNYATWRILMKYVLISKGLWAAVESDTVEHEADQKALATIGLYVKEHHLSTLERCGTAKLLDGGPPGCTSARQLSSLLTYSTHRVGTRPDRKPDGQTESHAPHTRASWQNPTVSSPDPMPSVSTLQLAATSGSHPPSGHSPMHAYNPLHFALFVILS